MLLKRARAYAQPLCSKLPWLTLLRWRRKSLPEKNSEITGEKTPQYLDYRAKKDRRSQVPIEIHTGGTCFLGQIHQQPVVWCKNTWANCKWATRSNNRCHPCLMHPIGSDSRLPPVLLSIYTATGKGLWCCLALVLVLPCAQIFSPLYPGGKSSPSKHLQAFGSFA